MVVHVIDTYSIIEVPKVCLDLVATNKVLARFTLEVQAGNLTFPMQVRDECREFLGDDTCTVWVEAVTGSRHHASYSYQMTKRALALCGAILDPGNPEVQPQVDVAAQACYLISMGMEATFVSNDLHSIDERMPLAEAAPILNVGHITVQDYIRDVLGEGALLNPGA